MRGGAGYGTIAVATVSAGAQGTDVLGAVQRWLRERAPAVDGFVAESVLVADDGRTVMMTARVRDREAHERLGRDPAQQTFWSDYFAPLFIDVRWVDGPWEVIEAAS